MAKKRECYLCGTKYNFCSTCDEDRYAPAWKHSFHSEDCAKIFQCCVDYNMSLISKDEAQDILLGCDLSNKKSFREDVKETIGKILEEKKAEVKVEEPKPFFKKNA